MGFLKFIAFKVNSKFQIWNPPIEFVVLLLCPNILITKRMIYLAEIISLFDLDRKEKDDEGF